MKGILKEKKMTEKKEPLEIKCSSCSAHFRLWIPVGKMGEWERGSTINCIRCGSPYLIKKAAGGFEVTQVPTPRVYAGTPAPGTAHGVPSAEESRIHEVETVLLVEDDRLSRKMVENSFKGMDLRLIATASGEEALHILDREKVHLLVVDLYLKDPANPRSMMDGEDLLKKVAQFGYNIPAIVTTGKEMIDDISMEPKWFDLHVKGFIQKGNPFWVDELKEKVADVMMKG